MNTEALPHQAATLCPNCGTPLGGKFCPGCGQPAHLHVPSAREFLHEFIAHYVALEGKLWKSVALLLFRPGRLTLEYIQGRRVRYVEPLRLYLSFSIIFFALFKLVGLSFGDDGRQAAPEKPAAVAPAPAAASKPAPAAASKPAPATASEPAPTPPAADSRKKEEPGLIEFEGDARKARNLVEKVHPALGAKVAHFSELPRAERNTALKRAFFSYAPYAIFALMPVFAALLKLLYLGSGRRYGEHVLFALHSNAFAFLCLSLLMLVPEGVPLVGQALFLWLVFYLPTAMRKVYGGTRLVTALRWMVLMTAHSLCILFAAVLAAGLAMMG
ncbi:DUF3667 domain-containing protein [Massilia sp.]|uniref:DUF3667 domain-containing protein n=1 Tax=Massilia sp. TaxID=1882437 RepID=UPI0028A83047|nr:DUF3667 domain-containing protein [Massilia sp.]